MGLLGSGLIDNRLEELRAYRGINPKPDDFDHYWAAALRERMTPRQMREFAGFRPPATLL